LEVIYNSTGEYEKAVAAGLSAIRNDPRVEPPYRNLATAYIGLNRLEDAKDILAQARTQHLDGSRLHQRVLEIAYAEGDQAVAEREVQWYAGRPDEYIGLALRAANADATGRREDARKLYRRAAAMALQRGLRDGALELEDADARAEALYGNCQSVRRARRPPLALALCGETAAAERLVAEASKLVPNGMLWNAVHRPAITAASEFRRGDFGGAIQRLVSAAPYERAYPEIPYLRGLAYMGLRKGPEADAEFRKMVSRRGAHWGILYALSQAGLGRAALLLWM
jgi:Flp pilus assembly protein TadD